jgi:3',5'-cyclic AMP phosphodiesterase CpdA
LAYSSSAGFAKRGGSVPQYAWKTGVSGITKVRVAAAPDAPAALFAPFRVRAMELTLAHVSDIHCGDPHFVPDLMERAIAEINDLDADIVVCSGDLTTFGFKEEFAQARRYLDRFACEALVVVPGNHDSRNVGYVHFEELIGERNSVVRKTGATVVAVDSTEPDLDHGHIGRGSYSWIEQQFAEPSELRVFVLHHHLLPIPGTGRERNVVYDAGDAIECLQRAGVQLVLSGHKHVPYAWKLENLFVVNAGTVSSSRLRGNGRPCYNIVEVDGTHVDVWRKYPFHEQEKIIQFSTETKTYEKYTARIEDEVRSS